MSLHRVFRVRVAAAHGFAVCRACIAIAAAAVAVTGCGERVAAGAATAEETGEPAVAMPASRSIAFDSLFVLERRIQLEEPDSALITEIVGLDVDARGRLLVPDPTSGQVRVYAPDGRLIRALGRPGKGPGELTQPMGAAFDAVGGVYVSEVGNPRITRFDASFALDTTFPLREADFGANLEVVGGNVVVFAMRTGPAPEIYDLYARDGSLAGRFHPLPAAVQQTPYWISAARSRLAVGAASIFVANNLLYPVRRYSLTGEPLGEIGTPPPSWRAPTRPAPGAFAGPTARAEFERWRRTFTTIAGLGVYQDSLLLVAHEQLDPDVLEYEEATYRADVYRLGTEPVKLYHDVPLPGPLLHAGGAVYLLLAGPGESRGWTLGRYRLTLGGAE
ncbi:MAG TPA: 6-bladed beta-propeller [Longimicrobiales bacterium]